MSLVIFILFLFFFALLGPTAYAGWIGAPYAPTRLPVVKKAMKKIGIDSSDVVVDLGAGDGKILLSASSLGARAYGFELSPILWAIAWFRSLRRKDVKVYLGNFYHHSLADATVIFTFLMPETMPHVRKYLATQKIPQAKYLMAYTFGFKDVQPIDIIQEKKCGRIYVYDLKELTQSSEQGNHNLSSSFRT